jgi:hypothetical protein
MCQPHACLRHVPAMVHALASVHLVLYDYVAAFGIKGSDHYVQCHESWPPPDSIRAHVCHNLPQPLCLLSHLQAHIIRASSRHISTTLMQPLLVTTTPVPEGAGIWPVWSPFLAISIVLNMTMKVSLCVNLHSHALPRPPHAAPGRLAAHCCLSGVLGTQPCSAGSGYSIQRAVHSSAVRVEMSTMIGSTHMH